MAQDSISKNFMTKRLAVKFDLQEICNQHSEDALNLYYLAIDDLSSLQALIPDEVMEQVTFYKEFSFLPCDSNSLTSLYQYCAQKVANANLLNLNQNSAKCVHALRSILFHAQFKKWYDTKLARIIIDLLLNADYKPSQKQLNKALCTAAYLGNAFAIKLLLQKGADCNFINQDDYDYTPLAYALAQEHNYSKTKEQTDKLKLLIAEYEQAAKLLINAGANVCHKIKNI